MPVSPGCVATLFFTASGGKVSVRGLPHVKEIHDTCSAARLGTLKMRDWTLSTPSVDFAGTDRCLQTVPVYTSAGWTVIADGLIQSRKTQREGLEPTTSLAMAVKYRGMPAASIDHLLRALYR